jgi:DNA-directed RNA polymerase specialized sigma24 family protein
MTGDELNVLRRLRRHAGVLVRGADAGDALLAGAMRAWLKPGMALDLRQGLRALYDAYQRSDCLEAAKAQPVGGAVAAALDSLPHPHRSAVLLQQLEQLDPDAIATTLGLPADRAAAVLAEAWNRMRAAVPQRTDVLIIEDEAMTGLELAAIAGDLGLNVVDCTPAPRSLPTPPGLVLADLRIGNDAQGGIRAIQRLGLDAGMPIVFVTGYPEDAQRARLRFPRARVVAKPFHPLALKLAILDTLSPG